MKSTWPYFEFLQRSNVKLKQLSSKEGFLPVLLSRMTFHILNNKLIFFHFLSYLMQKGGPYKIWSGVWCKYHHLVKDRGVIWHTTNKDTHENHLIKNSWTLTNRCLAGLYGTVLGFLAAVGARVLGKDMKWT